MYCRSSLDHQKSPKRVLDDQKGELRCRSCYFDIRFPEIDRSVKEVKLLKGRNQCDKVTRGKKKEKLARKIA